MAAIITLTTDFGADSPYVAKMKAVLLSRSSDFQVVDVCHSIPPQNIAAGSVVMRDCCFWFPSGTVHVGVVDPGVGSGRGIVACEIDGHFFVAPDNGLLNQAASQREATIIEVDQSRFSAASHTFHGRDIMAPVAAELSLGAPLTACGAAIDDFRTGKAATGPLPGPGKVVGVVEWIDPYGNLLTNIPAELLPESNQGLRFEVAGREILGLRSHYAQGSPGDLIALIGSNGRLEFAVVNGSAADTLGGALGASFAAVWDGS